MKIATLGPAVRLVVFQFLVRNDLVPADVPPKRDSNTPALPPVSGVEVLASTPRLNIFPVADKIYGGENYELVDAWVKPHETNWRMSFVRFVFCRKGYLNNLSSDFINKRGQLEDVFDHMIATNLWATQAHLNPYFGQDGQPTSHQVLMIGCAGRMPNTEVFSGGRDENNRGVGPKVFLSDISKAINLIDSEIVLENPAPAE